MKLDLDLEASTSQARIYTHGKPVLRCRGMSSAGKGTYVVHTSAPCNAIFTLKKTLKGFRKCFFRYSLGGNVTQGAFICHDTKKIKV